VVVISSLSESNEIAKKMEDLEDVMERYVLSFRKGARRSSEQIFGLLGRAGHRRHKNE
jgi:hypothetical protein